MVQLSIDQSIGETDIAWAARIQRRRNIADFTGWKNEDTYRPAFQRLLRDLKSNEAAD